MNKAISSKFPFESKYIEVNESNMHYIDENNQDNAEDQTTFVCIHGNPTSSYLWRNIIPYLKTKGRVIAFDLIGFGKSDKLEDYSIEIHSKFVDGIINKLKLTNIVFVIHDWGLAFGMYYARRNEEKIKGLVFMEGPIKPMVWKEFGFEPVRTIFKLFRTPIIGKFMNINLNMFVQKVLNDLGSKREFTKEEKEYYSKPFLKKKDRLPAYLFPKFIPINGKPENSYKLINNNHKWLQSTKLPKLIFWVTPGIVVKPDAVEEYKTIYPNLTEQYLGESAHFIQEDFPHEIGEGVVEWMETNKI